MGVAYLRFAVDNPSHYRVMFGGSFDQLVHEPELMVEAQGAFQALVEAVAALQKDGLFLRDDPMLMATYVWALVHGLATLAIDAQLPEPVGIDELMRYSFERLRTGIRANTENRRVR
jgi:hypothetical protein